MALLYHNYRKCQEETLIFFSLKNIGVTSFLQFLSRIQSGHSKNYRLHL